MSNDLLTLRRQEAAELARLQKAAAELPELERQEAERQHKLAVNEQRIQATEELDKRAKPHRLKMAKFNLVKKELAQQVVDIVEQGRELDREGESVARLAQLVAQCRIELALTPLGSWGPDPAGNRLQLQSETEQVLKEHKLPETINTDNLTGEGRALVALIQKLIKSEPMPAKVRPNGTGPFAGKMPIVDHHGNTVWK